MRVRARSIAPLRICGPGTSTMQGQNATSDWALERCSRPAAAPITPAIRAADSGSRKALPPSLPRPRRASAPSPALTAISSRLTTSNTPKITPSAAAPMAAKSAKRRVEADGVRPAASIAARASAAGMAPSTTWSITVWTASTVPMFTPSGAAGTTSGAEAWSSATTSSPQCGNTLIGTPSARPNCCAATTVLSVVCPCVNSSEAANATVSTASSRVMGLGLRWGT